MNNKSLEVKMGKREEIEKIFTSFEYYLKISKLPEGSKVAPMFLPMTKKEAIEALEALLTPEPCQEDEEVAEGFYDRIADGLVMTPMVKRLLADEICSALSKLRVEKDGEYKALIRDFKIESGFRLEYSLEISMLKADKDKLEKSLDECEEQRDLVYATNDLNIVTMKKLQHEFNASFFIKLPPQEDAWHHLAINKKGDYFEIYLTGKRLRWWHLLLWFYFKHKFAVERTNIMRGPIKGMP